VGEARFFSITYRLFKLPQGRLEALGAEEDYGQWAAYKGTLSGAGGAYSLDERHRFVKARKRNNRECGAARRGALEMRDACA
jgi:hypothetical protein